MRRVSSGDLSSASKAALNSVSAISCQSAASPSFRSNSLIANLRTSSAPASAVTGFLNVLAARERRFLIHLIVSYFHPLAHASGEAGIDDNAGAQVRIGHDSRGARRLRQRRLGILFEIVSVAPLPCKQP